MEAIIAYLPYWPALAVLIVGIVFLISAKNMFKRTNSYIERYEELSMKCLALQSTIHELERRNNMAIMEVQEIVEKTERNNKRNQRIIREVQEVMRSKRYKNSYLTKRLEKIFAKGRGK